MDLFDDGIFGGIFDLDGDGELNAAERGLEYMLLNELTEDEENGEDDD